MKTGPIPVLLERDAEFPPYAELREELLVLQDIYRTAMANRLRAPSPRVPELVVRDEERRSETHPRDAEPTSLPELQQKVIDQLLAETPEPLGRELVAERWRLYRGMARGRLHDLAVGVFSRTRTRLGPKTFDALFDTWLYAGGPRSSIFWRTADEFASFALARPELAPRVLRDLLGLEQVEWRVRQAPYAPTPGVDPLSFDRAAILAPARELLEVEYAHHEPSPTTDGSPRPEASTLVVFRRPDDSIAVLSLNPLAKALLDALAHPHASIAAALQQVALARSLNVTGALLESIATTFAQWHELGLLLGSKRSDDA